MNLTSEKLNELMVVCPKGLYYLSVPSSVGSEKCKNITEQKDIISGRVKITQHDGFIVLRSDELEALRKVFEEKFKPNLGTETAYFYQLPLPFMAVWHLTDTNVIKRVLLPDFKEEENFLKALSEKFDLHISFDLACNILHGNYWDVKIK